MKTEIKGLLACAGLASTKDTIPNKSMCTFSRIMTRFSLFLSLFTGFFLSSALYSQQQILTKENTDFNRLVVINQTLQELYKTSLQDEEETLSFSSWLNQVHVSGRPEMAFELLLETHRIQDFLVSTRKLKNAPRTKPTSQTSPLHEEDSPEKRLHLRDQYEEAYQAWMDLRVQLEVLLADESTHEDEIRTLQLRIEAAEKTSKVNLKDWIDYQRKINQSSPETHFETTE